MANKSCPELASYDSHSFAEIIMNDQSIVTHLQVIPLNATSTNMHQITILTENYGIERVKLIKQILCSNNLKKLLLTVDMFGYIAVNFRQLSIISVSTSCCRCNSCSSCCSGFNCLCQIKMYM